MHRQQFLALAVVQLDGRSLDLRMNYSLRCRLCLLGARHLDGHGAGSFGSRMEAEVGGSDDTQGTERAGEELRQVVAGHVLDDLAACFGHGAVVQDDSYAGAACAGIGVAKAEKPRWILRSGQFVESLGGRRVVFEGSTISSWEPRVLSSPHILRLW